MRRRALLPLLLGGLVAVGAASQHQVEQAPRLPAGQGITRFLAVADTGSGNASQRAVALQMTAVHRRRPVDLVLLAGDNLYPAGAMARFEEAFRRPYGELLAAGVPFHAVLGNHDIETANGEGQLAEPALGMHGRFYKLRRSAVEFFLIETNPSADWQRQLSWLRSVLASSTAPWKVVVGHHPIHSSGLHGGDPGLQAKLTPLLEKHGVQLYINGHDHHYERSQPINGTTYLVVGGGGAALRPAIATALAARVISVHSFAEIEASPTALRVTGWDQRGQIIDDTVIRRR